MESDHVSPFVLDRIAWAEGQLSAHGTRWRADREIGQLLERLGAAIRRSRTAMVDAGVTAECACCDRQDGGSCCGAGLEKRYDGVMLLINLLLGVELPRERADPRSCLFLRGNGCVLTARDVICVNYLCRRITDKLDRSGTTMLAESEGEELETLFRLHTRITRLLQDTRDG